MKSNLGKDVEGSGLRCVTILTFLWKDLVKLRKINIRIMIVLAGIRTEFL
jgi:hypothetical protein